MGSDPFLGLESAPIRRGSYQSRYTRSARVEPNRRVVMIDATSLRASLVLVCAWAAAHASAQQPSAGQASAIREACRSDYMANCAGVPPGGEAALACLKQNAAKVSPACQQALRAAAGSAPAPAAAPTAAAAPSAPPPGAAPSGANSWPHTVSTPNGTATIYQPQVISWPD